MKTDTRPQMGDEGFNTPLTRTQFIVQMAIHIARCVGLDAKRALPIAASCYKEFMDEIAVTHGDPRYAWDEAAARTVVAEYELAPSASLPQPTAGSTSSAPASHTGIKTEHLHPPIPTRSNDWVAYRGDPDSAPDGRTWLRGYGTTEQEAIDDLLEQEIT